MNEPKKYSRVETVYGTGVVLETFASAFIVRIYDKGDYTILVNDDWAYAEPEHIRKYRQTGESTKDTMTRLAKTIVDDHEDDPADDSLYNLSA